jgi:hypothetical protein
MRRKNLARTVRLNEIGARFLAPSRDPSFWNGGALTIGAINARDFEIKMHHLLRQAHNWAEVERLRNDNTVMIRRLDAATRESVEARLDARERELRDV